MTGRCLECLAAAVVAAALAAGCAPGSGREILYQTSTISALQEGVYDGEVTLAELLRHGDTGIGTFDALDGEMAVLDGRVYQVRADGKVYRPAAGTLVGFRLPELARGINVPGWHLHFLAADRTAGGHVLEATVGKARAELDVTPNLFVELPRGGGFGRADLSRDKTEELKRVER